MSNPQTNNYKIEWLKQYATNLRECSRLNNEILRWRSLAERTTRSFSLVPGAGGNGENLAQLAVEEIGELQSELMQELRNRLKLRRDIERAINTLPNATHAEIMRLRYIDCLKWEEIALKIHYSSMQVSRMHKQALDLLALPQGEVAAAG